MRGKGLRQVERTLDALGAGSLVVLMSIVFIDVVGRNLLNKPLPWGTEVLEVVLAVMIFALYPVLALRNGHITVDLVTPRPAIQRIQRLLACGVGALLFAVIAWCTAKQALRSAQYGDASSLLQIPTSVVLAGMAAMAAVTVLAFLAAAVRAWQGELPGPHKPVD